MVGKTSLFTILTGAHQDTRIGSTAARVGVAKVPDARLDELAKLFEPKKVTHASVEYVDMPAISKESLRELEMCPFVDELTRLNHEPLAVIEAEYRAEEARRNHNRAC